MTKLPAVKPRQIGRFLESNGFVLDTQPAATSFTTTAHRATELWYLNTIATCPRER